MFGSIGGPEILLLFVLGLLLFGPRKLPEIGRTIGKTLAEFRRATSDFSASLEREVALEKLKDEEKQPPSRPLAASGPVARESREAGSDAPRALLEPPPEHDTPPDA